jgi:GH25 family lysozyme M1 (1,4-beta-N-acetylmuramidase)
MRLDIVDLSHHNDVRSFDEMKAQGVIGVILKATEGVGYEDSMYAQRAYEAREAGLRVASYHFLHSGDIEAQMDWFYGVVQPEDGERMVIDHETDASLEELEEAVNYLDHLPSLPSRITVEITVYSGHLIREQLGDGYSPTLAEKTSLWIAHYGVSSPEWPKTTWPFYSLWQYSDAVTITGAVVGAVDGNEFNGSREHCADWMGPAIPVPEPVASSIDIGMSVANGTRVTLTINGEVTEYVAAGGSR